MKTQIEHVKVWTLALAMAGLALPAAAQQPSNTPQTTTTPTIEPYVVGQAKPPVESGTSIREMTLEQAIQIALENNLDLKVARMNPQIQDYTLQQTLANYRPTISGTFTQNRSSTPLTDATQIVPVQISQSQNYTTQYAQNLRKWGANFSANFTSNRATDNRPTQTRNPNLSASTRLQYSMPLLANFKIDATRNSLRTLAISRQVVDIQLRQTIENTQANVRTAYWALRQAIEAVQIQQQALSLSQRQLEDNKTKVEIGTIAPIDTVQNESQVASAEQQLLNASITWRSAELALKRLLVSGNDDPLYGQTINPTDMPTSLENVPVDIPRAIQNALGQRTDLEVSRKNIESSRFTLELRKNALLPSLTFNASYQLQGQGGDTYSFNRTTLIRTLLSNGGYGDALSAIGGFDQPTWSMSANFSYPLGMQSAKASFAQAQIQLQQSEANLKAQQLTVSTDVNNAGLAVQNAFQQLAASRKSAEAARRTAEATQTRFDNGMANNFEVATAVNNLTSARLNELNAVIRYVNAIAEFERKQKVGG
jgi:outer membrane protein